MDIVNLTSVVALNNKRQRHKRWLEVKKQWPLHKRQKLAPVGFNRITMT